MPTTQHPNYTRYRSEEIEERRLNAIIVAATLAFVSLLVIGALTWISSYEPRPGDSGQANYVLAD